MKSLITFIIILEYPRKKTTKKHKCSLVGDDKKYNQQFSYMHRKGVAAKERELKKQT